MENFELIIIDPPKRKNNWYPKGHKPFNKGVPMKEWMDGRKINRVLKYLEIGRKTGNHNLPGANRIPIVGIKDFKLFPFKCASEAEKILKGKGIKINRRNISTVCTAKIVNNNGTKYIRRKAGGFYWFFANEPEKYSQLIK